MNIVTSCQFCANSRNFRLFCSSLKTRRSCPHPCIHPLSLMFFLGYKILTALIRQAVKCQISLGSLKLPVNGIQIMFDNCPNKQLQTSGELLGDQNIHFECKILSPPQARQELNPSQCQSYLRIKREPQEVEDTCISWRFSQGICIADNQDRS